MTNKSLPATTTATQRTGVLLGAVAVFAAFAHTSIAGGQGASASAASSQTAVDYSTLQQISAGDSEAVAVEKAAKVLPRPVQTDWMRLERTFFIHFGPNTFRHVEWGTGHEDPSIFNPSELSADQWLRSVKEGGGKLVILVCKHHDGFVLWPTRYTGHSVAASPWRGGKGNLVKEVAEAAHKYGIELGVYLSPADLYQLRTNTSNPAGYYGDGSEKRRSTIPTDPTTFKTDPTQGRKPPVGARTFTYDVDDYNRYFLNQLYELLTEYGPIREVWFDGANPDPSVKESYDYDSWYDMIRKLQPNAVIACKGPDTRWVGNENGVGRATEWSVMPVPSLPETYRWPDQTAFDLGSRSKLVPGSYLWWYPAETNNPILHGWFWAPTKPSRTASELVDNYYESVGRNGNWLLNLSPDDRGLIPDVQLAHLRLMAEVVRQTFDSNLAAGATLAADTTVPAHQPAQALDHNLDTWWEAASGSTRATLTLKLPHATTFNVLSLQEAVDHRGQRIERFAVDVWDGTQWKQVDEQTTVAHKRLLRWNSPVTTDRVRVRILQSRLEPTIAEIGLFKQADMIQPPTIAARDANGAVNLSSPRGLPIRYTIDGSVPTVRSAVYTSAIPLARGGMVNAVCVSPDGKLGMLTTRYFAGLASGQWSIVSADSQAPDHAASNAIDGNPDTTWQNAPGAGNETPHQITVDMKTVQRIAGFAYLPRQDGKRDGVVRTYDFETSLDGKVWTKVIERGHFGNMFNNPDFQEIAFPAVRARYFRFSALEELGPNGGANVAEISVIPASERRK